MKPYCDNQDASAECGNCGDVFAVKMLDEVTDAHERVDAGGIMPAGQCPDCGALAYLLPDPEAPKPIHPELEACRKCGDPIYMDTIFDVNRHHCACCVDYDAGLDAVKQEAYSFGFKEGRRQRRHDEQDRVLEFVDLFAHRIRSYTDGDDDSELLDMIEADAKRLGVV